MGTLQIAGHGGLGRSAGASAVPSDGGACLDRVQADVSGESGEHLGASDVVAVGEVPGEEPVDHLLAKPPFLCQPHQAVPRPGVRGAPHQLVVKRQPVSGAGLSDLRIELLGPCPAPELRTAVLLAVPPLEGHVGV